MAEPDTIEIVAIDASPGGRALLRRFYDEAYVAQFPDANERESLAQIGRYLRLKAAGWYGPNNYHVLVAMANGVPVGGAVLDYLARADAGVVEFLFVLPSVRGAGLGRRLVDAGIAVLSADARRQGRPLRALVAEMNDPYRHPDTPDVMDPFERALTWGRWGFQRLLCPYAQPALSARQAAVEYLTLIVRPMRSPAAASVAADWVRTVVVEYLRWAMRIDAPEANPQYARLDAFLAARKRVRLQPLAASIGLDEHRPFDVHELRPAQPDFAAAVQLAARAIPERGRVASLAQFRAAHRAARRGGPAYHLWRISESGADAMRGMASFFALPGCGFGGYVVLTGALRGRGLLAPLIARIEARMMADGVRTEGWFIECGVQPARAFRKRGFADVPLEWRPPFVGGAARARAQAAASGAEPERLHLLYKPFGPVYPPVELSLRFVRQSLREILRDIYGVADPRRCATFQRALESLESRGSGRVPLLSRRPGHPS